MTIDPTIAKLAGEVAVDLTVQIILGASGKARRLLQKSRRRNALENAFKSGLAACLETMAPPDEWKKERYKAVFRRFASMKAVEEEFGKLIDPDPDEDIDLQRLEEAFREAGYDPEHFPGFDLSKALQAFGHAFYKAASGSKELQSVIKIRKLEMIVQRLDSMALGIVETAEASKQIAENTARIAAYFDNLAEERAGEDPSEEVQGKLIAYIAFGFDQSVTPIAQAFQMVTGKPAQQVRAKMEPNTKEYVFTSMDQFQSFIQGMEVIRDRYEKQPVKNMKAFIKVWKDEVMRRARHEVARFRTSGGRYKRRRKRFQTGLGDENVKYIVVGVGKSWVNIVEGLFMFDNTLATEKVQRDAQEVWFDGIEDADYARKKIQELMAKSNTMRDLVALAAEAGLERLDQRLDDAIDEALPDEEGS